MRTMVLRPLPTGPLTTHARHLRAPPDTGCSACSIHSVSACMLRTPSVQNMPICGSLAPGYRIRPLPVLVLHWLRLDRGAEWKAPAPLCRLGTSMRHLIEMQGRRLSSDIAVYQNRPDVCKSKTAGTVTCPALRALLRRTSSFFLCTATSARLVGL